MDDCIKTYTDLAQKVFNTDNVLRGVVPIGDDRCRFSHKDLADAVKSVVLKKLGDKHVTMGSAPDITVQSTIELDKKLKACPTFVVATRGLVANGPPVLFRSYGPEAATCTIWEAARATSVAASFFKAVQIQDPIDGTTEYFIDGGVQCWQLGGPKFGPTRYPAYRSIHRVMRWDYPTRQLLCVGT